MGGLEGQSRREQAQRTVRGVRGVAGGGPEKKTRTKDSENGLGRAGAGAESADAALAGRLVMAALQAVPLRFVCSAGCVCVCVCVCVVRNG